MASTAGLQDWSDALTGLGARGLLAPARAEELEKAFQHLRLLENRLSIVHDSAVLPLRMPGKDDDSERTRALLWRLARSTGYDVKTQDEGISKLREDFVRYQQLIREIQSSERVVMQGTP